MGMPVVSWLLPLSVLLGLGLSLPAEQPGKMNLETFQSDWPVGDPRRCLEQMRLSKFDVKRFEVMPGIGWDNLRNVEAGLVVSYNFTQCRLTDDGALLIPDNVFTVPIKYSSVETFAELFDHWMNSSSTTSDTVNIEAGLSLSVGSISGKFSYEHEQLKSKQIEDKAVTTRVQLRYYRYEAKLQPDPVLSPQFKNRLLRIAAYIELNHTEQAMYEGQLLVRDFGTHVLTSVMAGAGLVKDDYLKKDYVAQHAEDKSSILASASASFFGIFHMSASYGHSTDKTQDEAYAKMLTHSFIKSHGGPLIQGSNISIDEWVKGVDANLVPMDRAGDPLYFFVTQGSLPELSGTTVFALEKIVRQSIELYYEMNTIRGCTKLGAPNFSFSANFDDGSCAAKATNLTFGGMYQRCSVSGQYLNRNPCTGLEVINPKTGAMSCPSPYTPVQLQTGRRNGQTENKRVCHGCWLFFTCCHTEQVYSEAVYDSFWCAATGPVKQESGYLFGGLYTSASENPVTGSKGCPPTYYARQMFTDLHVCISDDYEMSGGFSVPFGGFFSCKSGNPLAVQGVHPVGAKNKAEAPNSLKAFMESSGELNKWPSRCPEGYSQHIATDDLGCAIHYCVQTGALSGPNLPPIKRPPFMLKPAAIIEHQDNLAMFDLDTMTWMKNDKALSILKLNKATYKQSDSNAEKITPGVAAAISIVATLACVVIATTIYIIVRRRQSRRQGPYSRIGEETFERGINYGATDSENASSREAA